VWQYQATARIGKNKIVIRGEIESDEENIKINFIPHGWTTYKW